jgi:hypothetical protein
MELDGNIGGHLGTDLLQLWPQTLAQHVADQPAKMPLNQRPTLAPTHRAVHMLISVRMLE